MATFTSSDIAFVTGAGSGIGRATCQLLAKEGATVVAADINKKGADETVLGLAGKNHMSIRLDVTKKDDVAKAISEVIAKYSSPPNIAVNCAGLILCEPLLDLTEETYNKLSDVNVKGTFWVTQAVIRELVAAQKKGAIVNIASIAKSGYALTTLYGANKAAVETFSLAAGREFGPLAISRNGRKGIQAMKTAIWSEDFHLFSTVDKASACNVSKTC
ncbi:hypothetical protein J6590_063484 [Homalodisca vitripennis]|nr:hypothetical protein J6590_063484 [Homalodisca vitripennis]